MKEVLEASARMRKHSKLSLEYHVNLETLKIDRRLGDETQFV